MSIKGAFKMKKDERLITQATKRGYEFGIYYELGTGENAFCFIHKDRYQAEKCLRKLMENTNYTQVEDWEGKTYSFSKDSFENAIGEKINRQKFKIVNRSIKYGENINFPKLILESIYEPRLKMEESKITNKPFY